MADKRAYFTLDVGYLMNPKIAPLLDSHPRAVLLHIECIAYAAQHLTDGVVPMLLAMRLACAEQCHMDMLVHCGLIDDLGDGTVAVHDYLEHQRSSSEVKKASDQARRASAARWAGAQSNASSMPDALPTAMPREREREREETSTSEVADAPVRPDVLSLIEHLDKRIEDNGSKLPGRTKKNLDAARLLLDRDGRTAEQVHTAIDWCQDHDFWRSNILSMSKLREKYDQIRLAAARPAGGVTPPPKPAGRDDWMYR